MKTRKEYMNKEVSHHDYYSQFITEGTLNYVLSTFGMEKLLASKDEHLNDICKHSNGGAGNWAWDYAPINRKALYEAGGTYSYSTITCVAKACARNLINESKAS